MSTATPSTSDGNTPTSGNPPSTSQAVDNSITADNAHVNDNQNKGNNSIIIFYKKKIESITKQLIDFNDRLSPENISEFEDEELTVRLEMLEKVNNNFEKIQLSLERESLDEIGSDCRNTILNLYIAIKTKLLRETNMRNKPTQMQQQFQTQNALNSTFQPLVVEHRRSHLPELHIPKFSGAYTEWPDFFGIYSTVIHKNEDLSSTEKFQHLRSALEGSALDTIRSLEPNDKNYEIAIDLLQKRFDNKLLNFQAHIKQIFDLSNVEKNSVTGLRELTDKAKAHYRALNTIATKEQLADGLLINLLCQKMDFWSKSKWEENLSHDKLPSWSDLENFLDKRCCALENVQTTPTRPRISNNTGKKAVTSSVHTLVAAAAPASSSCVFCGSAEHLIYTCTLFGNLSPKLRRQEAKKLNLCYNCLRKGHSVKACKSSHCRHCKAPHHTLLHPENIIALSSQSDNQIQASQLQTAAPSSASVLSVVSSSSIQVQNHHTSQVKNLSLIATAIINVRNRSGLDIPCRAVLDSASQISFVTTRLVNQLQLKCIKSNTHVSGIFQSGSVADRTADIYASSQSSNYSIAFTAVVASTITDNHPRVDIDISTWNIPSHIRLADPMFYKSSRVDILIGVDYFYELLCSGKILLGENLPIIQETQFGWVVAGGRTRKPSKSTSLVSSTDFKISHEEDHRLDTIMKGFWEVENNFGPTKIANPDDMFCEQHFLKNYTRLASGEIAVRLPLKRPISDLGESFSMALQRFQRLEKRLHHDPALFRDYQSFIHEYRNLKHMSPAEIDQNTPTFFLPHHCVFKAESTTTKLRVVFDGSAKSSTGFSLNDLLHSGPTIQPKLFNTLLRFRLFKIALTGDIGKMYRCVRVLQPDNFLQCIIWRDSPGDNIQIFKLDTVTYGTKPAAFLAIRAMQQLAYDEEKSHPLGAKIICRDFYVDDLISGGDTLDEVIAIRNETTAILQKGNFKLRKWCSNDERALHGIAESDREKMLTFHDNTNVTKALGLVWDPKSDFFIFSTTPTINQQATKRKILSTIARFYDPLGLIGPVVAKAKIFMQNLWRLQLQWDEILPQELQTSWQKLYSELNTVKELKFPRFVLLPDSSLQIHAFCDASLNAYGACVYMRSQDKGKKSVQLLCSKSRVSPLKQLTIPKLELSAALLLSELLAAIGETKTFNCETYCWSDSTVVLSWLRNEPSTLNVFVANRVKRIQELTKDMKWCYVPTSLNPADILSRGATPNELLNCKLWANGPPFIQASKTDWPKQPPLLERVPELRRNVLLSTIKFDATTECKYSNCFSTMQRIYAYVYRYYIYGRKCESKRRGPLQAFDIKMGTQLLIRMIQQTHFEEEYNALKKGKNVKKSSNLSSLNPFVDDFGLLRVGGRLQNSSLSFDARHPMIMPKHHPITKAMIEHFHRKLLHAGPQSLLASIRQQFWPIGGRKLISSIINKCILCFRMKPRTVEHIMGNLPASRVRANPTFATTGVDFCGPFYFKSKIRNRPLVSAT